MCALVVTTGAIIRTSGGDSGPGHDSGLLLSMVILIKYQHVPFMVLIDPPPPPPNKDAKKLRELEKFPAEGLREVAKRKAEE